MKKGREDFKEEREEVVAGRCSAAGGLVVVSAVAERQRRCASHHDMARFSKCNALGDVGCNDNVMSR